MLKKSYWHLLGVRNRWQKNFFSSRIFDQSDFGKKWNSFLPLFLHWNRETSEHWCWKNSIYLCCTLKIGVKKVFFLKNFSTNQISRKNQIQLLPLLSIGIERPVKTDAVKILLTPVVLPKSGKKKFFLIKIFQPIGIRQKKSNSIIPLFLYWNRETSEHWCWKHSIDLCCTLEIWEKKNFFFEKFFIQSDFEKKWNSIIRFFCHWNREMSEHWCWKNSIDLLCILQIGEKKFFFLSKFFNQSDFEKKSSLFISLFLHWNLETREHWCWKYSIEFSCTLEIGKKKIFFLENFSTNQISRKNQIHCFTFSALESRDQWRRMLIKFYWPLLYSRNRGEKFLFF